MNCTLFKTKKDTFVEKLFKQFDKTLSFISIYFITFSKFKEKIYFKKLFEFFCSVYFEQNILQKHIIFKLIIILNSEFQIV